MLKMRISYGKDPTPHFGAFYWPGSAGKRKEIYAVKKGEPDTYESTYQGRPGARSGSIFLEEDFDYYNVPAGVRLEFGINGPGVREFVSHSEGLFQSWDTAFSALTSSAFTVCETFMMVPCSSYHRGEDPAIFGPCEFHYDELVLDVFRAQLDFADLTPAFKRETLKWQPERSIVEKKASGISLFSVFNSAGYPILGVEANISKRARAINGVGAGSVQGWHRQHRVRYPRLLVPPFEPEWFADYKRELKDFTGEDGQVCDQADAHVHGCTYVIKRGSSGGVLPSDWSPEHGTPISSTDASSFAGFGNVSADPRALVLMGFGELTSYVNDPFDGMCERCSNYSQGFCSLFQQRKVAMDSCPAFTGRYVS